MPDIIKYIYIRERERMRNGANVCLEVSFGI